VSAEAARDTGKTSASIAQAFVKARRSGLALPGYPGPIPADIEAAYACQEAAISLWSDQIVGWKIGLIAPEFERTFRERRLAGPIFRQSVISALRSEAPTPFPVFVGGFAAVEAEFVFEIADDVPGEKLSWTSAEASGVNVILRIGIELAGSPLAAINALGPTAVISDFGNNAGLILGPPIKGWREMNVSELTCESFIDGMAVGRGNAAALPGGPIEALRWLLEHSARRSRPLRKGQFVSTGAVTGIHEISAGQTAIVSFGRFGPLRCVAKFATQDRENFPSPHPHRPPP
jgi:2-keto-4-pentenoate hydratase